MVKTLFSKNGIIKVWLVMQSAFTNFKQNDPLRIAAATAFFATFAIPAILVVILQIFGFFLNRRKFGGNIIDKLSDLIGDDSASEIRRILVNMLRIGETWYITLLVFLFLIFVSTTLFLIIRNSINQLWQIRVKEHPGVYFHIRQRLRSLGIISFGGFLMLVVFILEGIRFFLEKKFDDYIPNVSGFLNELIFFLVTAIWFSIAFRYIANARPAWRPIFIASAFTAILFTIGKVILRSLLLNSNIGAIYGTSGAILLVMLFVFYSSFIFYYGACLVNTVSEALNAPIAISAKAYKFRYEEISTKDEPEI